MKRAILAVLSVAMMLLAAACGANSEPASPTKAEGQGGPAAETTAAAPGMPENLGEALAGKRVLVAYFSRADENTGGVGFIEKGNTKILAEMAAELTGADLFEIKPAKPYPREYKPATEVAKEEKEKNARPAIVMPLPDIASYDVVLLGYPIWWGDLPMAVYTFLDAGNFQGKVIAPFCTHEGSGLGSTAQYIAQATGAKVTDGFELRGNIAQNSPAEAKEALIGWLRDIDFIR